MKITIYAVGKLKERHWQAAAREYEKRLRRYVNFAQVEIKDANPSNKSPQQIQSEESANLRRRIAPDAQVIALDKSGKSINSNGLAQFLDEKSVYGPKEIVFCLGGALGFSQDFLQQASLVFSLSKLTFPHELARIILLEQLYRAFTILSGEKYHK